MTRLNGAMHSPFIDVLPRSLNHELPSVYTRARVVIQNYRPFYLPARQRFAALGVDFAPMSDESFAIREFISGLSFIDFAFEY